MSKRLSLPLFHPGQVLQAVVFRFNSNLFVYCYKILTSVYCIILPEGMTDCFFRWVEMEDHMLLFLRLVR
jgi:hypothetical protein